MTDKPATTSLGVSEWRGLVLINLAQAQEFVQGNALLSKEHLPLLIEHMERVIKFARSWHLSQPATGQTAVAPAEQQPEKAEPKKKRGGWPKGKPRTRQAPQ